MHLLHTCTCITHIHTSHMQKHTCLCVYFAFSLKIQGKLKIFPPSLLKPSKRKCRPWKWACLPRPGGLCCSTDSTVIIMKREGKLELSFQNISYNIISYRCTILFHIYCVLGWGNSVIMQWANKRKQDKIMWPGDWEQNVGALGWNHLDSS